MTDHETDDYADWLKQRRTLPSNDNLTDRIMSRLDELTPGSPEPLVEAPSTPVRDDRERFCALASEVSPTTAGASARPERPGHASTVAASSVRDRGRIGPAVLLTAAAIFFVAKIALLVGNLAFPTESFPEFANDHKIEEPADEHGNAARS